MNRQEAARRIAELVDSDLQGVDEIIRDLINSVPRIDSDEGLNTEVRKQLGKLETALAGYEELQEAKDHDMVVESTEEILDLILTIAELINPGRRNLMWAHVWDEISSEWATLDLAIPVDSSPEMIVQAVDQECATPVGSIPMGQEWTVKSHSRTGPILTIECRTPEDLLGIILVNDEENTSRAATAEEVEPPL